MANDTTMTIVGNLVDDPVLRFLPTGAAVCNFTVAATPSHFDKATSEWVDDPALFLNCSIWRQAAENVAESLRKGMRVVATGKLKQRSYETQQGEKRTVVELDVEEVGPSLRYATAAVTKTPAAGGGQQGTHRSQQPRQSAQPGYGQPQAGYGAPAPQNGGNGFGNTTAQNDPWGQAQDSPPY